MTNSLFDTSLTAHLELFSTLQTVRPAVEAAAERMKAAIAAGGKVLIAGNGGSAADALKIKKKETSDGEKQSDEK